MWLHSVVIVSLCVGLSLQLQDCELSSGLRRNEDLNGILTVTDNSCAEGFISWHYPRGNLTVHFPRSVAGSDVGRRPMKVCLTTSLGQGVTGIQQLLTSRRGRVRTHDMQLPEDGTEGVCSRPSRRDGGITISLLSDGPSYYLQVVRYNVEVVERRRGRNRNSRRRPSGGRPSGGRPEITVGSRGATRDIARFAGRPKRLDN